MDVIALRGDATRGKSETLNVVYQYLLLFGYNQIPGHYRGLGAAKQRDFIDILEKKGLRVGFATMGDYDDDEDDRIQNLLDYLEFNGCHIAICSCRRLQTPNAVKKITTTYPKHWIIDKTVTSIESEQRIRNGEDAERIYKLI